MNQMEKVNKICGTCGKSFVASMYPCHKMMGCGKYCSPQCAGRKYAKCSDEQVIALFKQCTSCLEIAKRFGCSETTIAKKLRRNGLSYGKARKGKFNGMHGKNHTQEAIKKITDANRRQFSNQEARDRHAILTCEQIRAGRTGKAYNRLETAVATSLQISGVKFVQQFRLGRFLYDFFLPDSNTLLESHGTFWHADPRKYSGKTLSAIQIRNLANDKKKAEYAQQHGYNLQIVWELDVMQSQWNGLSS